MNIPQVNALATDRNRKQSEWIVKKLGYTHMEAAISDAELGGKLESALGKRIGLAYDENDQPIALPNGSFTLDQVVGMLEAEYIEWDCAGCASEFGYEEPTWGTNPHDLTAAMDALIKVLEEKKCQP